MPSKVKLLSKAALLKMHTGSLLTRRSALLACEESFSESDQFNYENEPNPHETGYIEFKDTEVWSKSYRELKEVLSTRENVLSKKERKELRCKKAQQRN